MSSLGIPVWNQNPFNQYISLTLVRVIVTKCMINKCLMGSCVLSHAVFSYENSRRFARLHDCIWYRWYKARAVRQFKFTRPEVLTTMLFWDQPEEGASWSPQSWYLNTNLQYLQCVVPQKNGIFKFYFTSHQCKIMPLLYENNTQRHYRFYWQHLHQ